MESPLRTTPCLDAAFIPPVYKAYTLLKTSPPETILCLLSRYAPYNYIIYYEKLLSPYKVAGLLTISI